MIAALYIDEHGPYPKLANVDAWGVTRDARLYEGPEPVVAHPPCGPWGAFAHLCKSPEQDPALALRAVDQVRKCGGVLEHPRRSRLWQHVGLPLPGEPTDAFGGRAIEVDQVEWGHAAHKRTWLYLVRVPDLAIEAPPFPARQPTHDLMGGRGRNSTADRGGKMEASKEKRRRTPPLFAEYLVRLARAARVAAVQKKPYYQALADANQRAAAMVQAAVVAISERTTAKTNVSSAVTRAARSRSYAKGK